MSNHKKQISKGYITSKLAFFDHGWGEKVLYRLNAKTTEKIKGLLMIDKVKDFFGLTNNDIKKFERDTLEEEIKKIKWIRDEKIKWTRDKEGKIVSLFKPDKLNLEDSKP